MSPAVGDFEVVIRPSDILKEGWLLKQSRYLMDWRRRWVVLTQDYLCTFKAPGVYSNPTEILLLKQCTTVKSAEDEIQKNFVFRVDSPNRVFLLVANSAQEKESWIGAVGRQMVQPTSANYCEDDIIY